MQPTSDDGAIDMRALLLIVFAGWRWIVGAALVGGLVALGIGFLMTPIYRATTVLVPAGGDRNGLASTISSTLGPLGNLASLAGVNIGSNDAHTEEALAVLRSRQFTQKFIADENLMPELFDKYWDEKAKAWKVAPEKQPTMAKAFKIFNEKIRLVGRDKKTGLITLQIDWRDRDKAAEWANKLVDRLNAEMRARAIAQSEGSLVFLEQELANTTVIDTREAINRLIEVQIKQRMLANVTQEYALRTVDRASKPDIYDKVRPKKALMAVIGAFLGMFIAAIWVLFRGTWTKSVPDP